MLHFKRFGLGAAGLLALVAGLFLAMGWGSAVAAQVSSVFITNTPANPVPVDGTLTVTSPPASPLPVHEQGTATISGTVTLAPTGNTVTVGNFPSTQTVSGKVSSDDLTTILDQNSVPGQVNNNQNSVNLIGPVDTSKSREVRLSIGSFGTSTCANVEIDVYTSGQFLYSLDQFTLGSPSATRVYDVPGPNLSVQAFHTDTNMLLAIEVVGRGN